MTCKKVILTVVALLAICSVDVFGQGGQSRKGGGQQGPPPEAFTACEGKSAGDTAEFTSPRGDAVIGTCEEKQGKLVLVADHRKNKKVPENRRRTPPEEAYTACEGKNSGDTADFVNPRGDTVTGRCEQEGDRLVLRPDNPPEGAGGRK